MPNARLPLNDYQQLMLQLSMSTPYNAVHAVLMKKNLLINASSIQQSINKAIKTLEIGRPLFSSNMQHITFVPLSEPVHLETCCIALEKHIDNEMNTLFSIDEFPLRFFMLNHDEKLYFSVTYNHWIGDAYAISQLIAAVLADLQGTALKELSLNTHQMANCFKHIYRHKTAFYRYIGVIKTFFKFSNAFRTIPHEVVSTESGCYAHLFEKEVLGKLLAMSKEQGITLNDLFIAILARIFGNITQEKRAMITHKRLKPLRDRIVIGVISNIRSYSMLPLENTFGLFLGFFYVSFKDPERHGLNALCQIVHSQTERLKHTKAAVKQYLLFKIQKGLWDRAKTKKSQYRLFSKNTPITVGISNMNLNENNDALQNGVDQYIRFSPTAMVCPMVFNLSTINGYLSLGLNFRKTCYSPMEAVCIKNKFVIAIDALAKQKKSLINELTTPAETASGVF